MSSVRARTGFRISIAPNSFLGRSNERGLIVTRVVAPGEGASPPVFDVPASYASSMPIRVVLADDHYLVREGVRRLLETEPDVVVTDIRMPPSGTDEGIQAAARLREEHPEVGVVVLSQYAQPSYALALLEGGTAGRAYHLKERVDDIEQLGAAVRAVAAGGSVIDAKVVEALVAAKARAAQSPLDDLTRAQPDVL